MPLGESLRARGQHYIAKKDDKGTWRILDAFNKNLDQFSAEDDIPDNHPAVTILTEGAFIELIRAATIEGDIVNASVGTSPKHDDCVPKEMHNQLLKNYVDCQNELKDTIMKLGLAINNLDAAREEKPRSDSYETTRHAIDSIERLAGMSNIKGIEESRKS